MITLYGHPISGNVHRVTALLTILDVEYQDVLVDLGSGAHLKPDFQAMNPLTQIPVLTDGDLVLRDSTAILVYLARKYDSENRWLPVDPAGQAKVQQWLATAVNELMSGPAMLRAIKLFAVPMDEEAVRTKTSDLFDKLFEPQLSTKQWLVGDSATLADIACYSYVDRVVEGGFSLEPYPAIRSWLARVEAIDGFPAMGKAAELMKSA